MISRPRKNKIPAGYDPKTTIHGSYSKMKLSFPAKFRVRGFALVVTLMLMVLLALIAVGLLSLSAVSLRGSYQTIAQSEARANAQLALMLAIGELQKSMGPDQRVSASGAIVADSGVKHPHWTGVWDSWRAGAPDPSAPGPDVASEHSTIAGAANSGMAPTYKSRREDHFRSWLVSLTPDEAQRVDSAQNITITGESIPGKDADGVILVGRESIGSGSDLGDYVSARLLAIQADTTGSASTGRYGWWVGDESQKARIMDDPYKSSANALTSAEKIFRQQSPGSTGTTTVMGLKDMTDDTQLAGLPSLRSLDLVSGATGMPGQNFHSITPWSYQVLSDIREGGLKRDLSILLERPIALGESSDEFMLYKFNDNERVPIQDLAAYFQLYHQDFGDPAVGNQGVRYASGLLSSGIQTPTPDYGGWRTEDKFQRQYTSLYRSPVPIKMQILFGLLARPSAITNRYNLGVTFTMSITYWNPTNLPLVMDNNSSKKLFQRFRLWCLSLGFQFNNNGTITNKDFRTISAQLSSPDPTIELDVSPNVPLVFAPGEVKVFSIPYNPSVSLDFTRFDGTNQAYMRLFQDWDPDGFMPLARGGIGIFKSGDKLKVTVNANCPSALQPMYFQLGQTSYHDVGSGQIGLERSFYNYTLASRSQAGTAFKDGFMMRGFEGNAPITVDIPTTTLINGSASGVSLPFLNFSLMAGSETHETASGVGGASGRKFASRPFLHSSSIRPSMIDDDSLEAFYNSGWNWWIEPINSVLEAPVQVTPEGNGFYGGGYGPSFGTTHIVQQEVPVVPPMSIASLSHAHLGGFSLSNQRPPQSGVSNGGAWSLPFEPAVLATGRGGLFPNALQAIGNSYAHPQLPAGKAYDGVERTFRVSDGPTPVVFADHSYLANKALWDEFFFSSITPQPDTAKIFESPNRTAAQVAEDFFFHVKPLPNRRMTPYAKGLDQIAFDAMFTAAQQQQFSDGLADRIASHLMVEGPFNVNSTSVEAWKVFLSSLKGKAVAYLDKAKAKQGTLQPDEETPTGIPVGAFSLPAGKPTGATTDPAAPGQWTGSRELSESEIGELATAIVKQVKLRGPFLSLSEFVNRRLDSSNPALSAKGALQAALDDDAVSINAAFRTPARLFSAAEMAGMNPAFPEALDGPAAYGSSAYLDQADILRNFAGQLTPRGDTFVIRTYGDSLDRQGNVLARAWCEAVVQRIPDYVDSTEESHLKQSVLQSEANKIFGRKFEIVSFRWLNPYEI